jgi:bleomycin hydrolase
MVQALNKKPQNNVLTPSWKKAIAETVDAYLGQVPDNTEDFTFTVDGKNYTPKTYAKHLDLNMDDYVELTSFTHHPYYKAFAMEIPDNWQMHTTYNIPLNELLQIAENAIMKGYTFAWGADVSERGFSHRKGLAIVPQDERTVQNRKSNDLFFDENGEKIPNAFYQPVKEKKITPLMRQQAFEDGRTTDDHGMHIVGIVKDQHDNKYFVVKNSWGKSNQLNGYFLASYPYFKYKTIDIFVHKDALPKDLKKKLDIK